MKISAEWTDAERLKAINMIADEMIESFYANDINSVKVVSWAQRLAFVASCTGEFLEDNREDILKEYLSLKTGRR